MEAMDKQCDFCVASRPFVYCNSDAAYLCLLCDVKVHSANALSSRHHRNALCDLCRCRPAIARCFDHAVFLCRGCDFDHETSCQKQRDSVKSYDGCPSAMELAALWKLNSNVTEVSSSYSSAKGVKDDTRKQSNSVLQQIVDLDRVETSDATTKEPSGKNDLESIEMDYFGGEVLELENSFWQCNSSVENNEMWMQDTGFFDDIRNFDNVMIPEVDPKFDNFEDIFGGEGGSMDNTFSFSDKQLSSGKPDQLCGSTIQQQENNSKETSKFDQPRALSHPNKSSYSTASFSLSKNAGESSCSEYKEDGHSHNRKNPDQISREKVIMRYKEKKTARNEKQAENAAARSKSVELKNRGKNSAKFTST